MRQIPCQQQSPHSQGRQPPPGCLPNTHRCSRHATVSNCASGFPDTHTPLPVRERLLTSDWITVSSRYAQILTRLTSDMHAVQSHPVCTLPSCDDHSTTACFLFVLVWLASHFGLRFTYHFLTAVGSVLDQSLPTVLRLSAHCATRCQSTAGPPLAHCWPTVSPPFACGRSRRERPACLAWTPDARQLPAFAATPSPPL